MNASHSHLFALLDNLISRRCYLILCDKVTDLFCLETWNIIAFTQHKHLTEAREAIKCCAIRYWKPCIGYSRGLGTVKTLDIPCAVLCIGYLIPSAITRPVYWTPSPSPCLFDNFIFELYSLGIQRLLTYTMFKKSMFVSRWIGQRAFQAVRMFYYSS